MPDLIWIGVVLLVISIIAYALGAKGTAGMTAGVGRMILIVGVVIFLIILVLRMMRGTV